MLDITFLNPNSRRDTERALKSLLAEGMARSLEQYIFERAKKQPCSPVAPPP